MSLKSSKSDSREAVNAVRKPRAPKFSFSKALLGENVDSIEHTDQPSDMDHYFARKKFESDMNLNEESVANEDLWNDNQSNASSNNTFIENETLTNTSGLWDGYFDREYDWLNNAESSDLNKSSSYDDYPSSRERSFERPSSGSNGRFAQGDSDNSRRLPKRKPPPEEYFDRMSNRRRPDRLDLMSNYQPTPSLSEPILSRSFNESTMPSYDVDSDEQSQEETRKRKAYRKKVETHYKKLVENKVMTPESEILNQSWSSVDARAAGIGGTDSPSYKIGVDESDWKEIDHHRSMSIERDRSNSSLAIGSDDVDMSFSRASIDSVRLERRSENRKDIHSVESSPEHQKSKNRVKKKVRVRRHDSLIKYGSEPDLSSRPKADPIMDMSQSQEFQNYSFSDREHVTDSYRDQNGYGREYNSETGEATHDEGQDVFYKDKSDYYKTLPRGMSPKRNLSRPRSTPNLAASKKHQMSPDFEGGSQYPWKYVPHPKQQQVDNFYVNFTRRDPSESSDRSSRLDPQTYQSYAAGILHSSRKSEQFLKLQQRYAMLERIAEIEEGTLASNEILGRRNFNVIHPQLMRSRSSTRSLGNASQDDGIVDYLLLSKYKLENLEELKDLYAELQEAQDRDEFFYDAGKVQESQWSPFDDIDLALKETNIGDLYSVFELGQPNFNTKSYRKRLKKINATEIRRDLSFMKLKDKYKHLDEESRKQKMMAEFWKMKFGRGRRGSDASITSATSTATQGSYIQIMENVAKKSKERPLYGYHIKEQNNSFDQYVEKIKRVRSMPNVSEESSQKYVKAAVAEKESESLSYSRPRASSHGRRSPEGLGRQRANLNGGLKPPSGRSSESGYDSVERDLHKISKEPAKSLEELWDIIDGKNSLLTKKYKDIMNDKSNVGRHEEITVAYGSYEKGFGNKAAASKGATSPPKPVVSCFGSRGKPDPDYDYPDGIPGNIKRTKFQASKHSPPGQGQGEPWRSEVRGVVGADASEGDDARDRRLAQGSEFDRYHGNEAVKSSQKRYENFKVNRSWRKDSKPQPGAVSAALSRLSLGEPVNGTIREQREPLQYQSAVDRGTEYNPSSSRRETGFSYTDGRRGDNSMTKSQSFGMDYSRDKNGPNGLSARHGQDYTDRSSGYGSSYGERATDRGGSSSSNRNSGSSFLDVSRDSRDSRSSRLDRYEDRSDRRLAAMGMQARELNPEAFHSAKSKFESPWPEDENYPKTAFASRSTRTPLGRYEAKIRSRSESPSRAMPSSADKDRTEYKYQAHKGGNLKSSEYGSMAKSTLSLQNHGRNGNETNLSKSNSGVTLKYNPKTGKVSDPTEGYGRKDTSRQDSRNHREASQPLKSNKHEKKFGLQIPRGPNRVDAGIGNVSYHERRPDGQSAPSQQSSLNNTYRVSAERVEHHMRLEDSDRSHRSLEPVRLNLLSSSSSVLQPRDKIDSRVDRAPAYSLDLSSKDRSLNDLSKFNRSPRPFVPSSGQIRSFGSRSRDSDFPNLSEFREEIKREVTGKEKSPPESETQDVRPTKPPRSWSTMVMPSQGSQDSLNDYGDVSKFGNMNVSDGLNKSRMRDQDQAPEPGRLQKWNTSNLVQSSSLASSNDTLIIKGSDPDLSGESQNRTFQSVKQMKNALAKNLEKARSEPDMLGMVNVGSGSPREAKSEESVQETSRSSNFHEIRAKYEVGLQTGNSSSKSTVPRTVSGDLKDIDTKYSRGDAFKDREWEKAEPQTPKTPLGAPMPLLSQSHRQAAPTTAGYPARQSSPSATKATTKNYNTSPIVEQVQRLISSDDTVRQDRDSGMAEKEVRAKRYNHGLWDVMRPYSPPAHEVSAKMLDNLSTIESEWQKEKKKNVYTREIVMRPDRQSSPAPSQQSQYSQGVYGMAYGTNHGMQHQMPNQPHMSTSRSSPSLSSSSYPHDTSSNRHYYQPPPQQSNIPSAAHYSKDIPQQPHSLSHQQHFQHHPHHKQQQHEEPEYSTIDRRQKQRYREQRLQQQQQLHPHMQQPQQPQYTARESRVANTYSDAGLPKSKSAGNIQSAHAHAHPPSRHEYQPMGSSKEAGYRQPEGTREYHGGTFHEQQRPASVNAAVPRPKSAMAGLVKYTDPQYHVYTAQSRHLNPSERSFQSPERRVSGTDEYPRSPANTLDRRRRDEENARRRDYMEQMFAEEKRRRMAEEVANNEARRHSDWFTPSQKSPIPSADRRFDEGMDAAELARPTKKASYQVRGKCKALYNFTAQNPRELSFRKGDIIYLTRMIDSNWYEGEHHGRVGIFPENHVEIVTSLETATAIALKKEGTAVAKYNFNAQTSVEMSLRKGDVVHVIRRIDENWFEGRHGDRQGIFPSQYVDIMKEPETPLTMTPMSSLAPTPAAGSPSQLSPCSTISNGPAPTIPDAPLSPFSSSKYDEQFDWLNHQFEQLNSDGGPSSAQTHMSVQLQQHSYRPDSYGGASTVPMPPSEPHRFQTQHQVSPQYSAPTQNGYGPGAASSAPGSYQSLERKKRQDFRDYESRMSTGPPPGPATKKEGYGYRKYKEEDPIYPRYRSIFRYMPQNEDELELQEGDTVYVMEKCDDGWFVGTSERTKEFGTFPGNYVQPL